MKSSVKDVAREKRFAFGLNWNRFLSTINEERTKEAEKALKDMLGIDNLTDKEFLDIGSGSGLSSLAARRLGAKVHSFDIDLMSVSCTKELKTRYFPNDSDWIVDKGSVLDISYLQSLGQFDIVYSWGVLHHTGAMWQGLENACNLVRPGGQLFLAIYNDQRWVSSYWRFIKLIYNKNLVFRLLVICFHLPYLYALRLFYRILTKRIELDRGMSLWHDMLDWLGGYPFEVAMPEEIFEFFFDRGFILTKLKTCGARHGCNEFVFALPSSV
ncbi:MAG: class I SAM-dependent methyltransferase [Syntrophobacterales bacterium]